MMTETVGSLTLADALPPPDGDSSWDVRALVPMLRFRITGVAKIRSGHRELAPVLVRR
jgi:hypothetical protein